MTTHRIKDVVEEVDKLLAKHRAVEAVLPDSIWQAWNGYRSKTVNKNYTNFEFLSYSYALYVMPYYEITYDYNDEPQTVRVYSSPKKNRLVYIHRNWRTGATTMRFARMAINMRNHNFKGDMFNDCRSQIMGFIKEHPNVQIDDRNLEPRLKQMLSFI